MLLSLPGTCKGFHEDIFSEEVKQEKKKLGSGKGAEHSYV